MTFKPAIWQPIAIVLSGVNLVAVGAAAAGAETWHAAVHAGVALGFGLWAQRMRRSAQPSELPGDERLDALEGEVGKHATRAERDAGAPRLRRADAGTGGGDAPRGTGALILRSMPTPARPSGRAVSPLQPTFMNSIRYLLALPLVAAAPMRADAQALSPSDYACRFVEVPVRDGVHLHTSICAPEGRAGEAAVPAHPDTVRHRRRYRGERRLSVPRPPTATSSSRRTSAAASAARASSS